MNQPASVARPKPVRTPASEDVRLALRAATMYHLQGATQAEIAAKLGISRPTAGRLLARARSQGLVRVEIAVPAGVEGTVDTELEAKLEDRFGLSEVVVVPEANSESDEPDYDALGRRAAEVLVRRIQPSSTLGFTWGPETVSVASSLPDKAAKCSAVVQLDGSMTVTDYQTGVDFTIGRCAQQLQANPVRLNAPLYADPATVESMRNDSVISKALKSGSDSDIMVFGVGAVSTATTLFAGSFVDATMLDELEHLGAVGEIGGRFYTINGDPVEGRLPARTVSVSLEAVKSCDQTILVSGGTHKRQAVLGALRGGLANVLVTDVECGQWLLDAGATVE
ncbi:deoxyribonucleoside regulator [Rhodococcus sp. 27YEA15]|uniref:sugar-binding transcriptional regulator n=1 Tax=Rhodococcus sp. 27YEA15 TaxID=3156259 RepID=UPI003C7E692D